MSSRRVESFLLRIVVPDGQDIPPERWRGRIQHVASGAEQQIDDFTEVVSFISQHLSQLSTAEFRFDITPVAE